MANTNHANPTKTLSLSHFLRGYTWEDVTGYDDEHTTKWTPQGITTSADALDVGVYQTKKVILIDWYNSVGQGLGVRLSFIDRTTSGAASYRNALLVEPYTDSSGKPNFKAVKVHGGVVGEYAADDTVPAPRLVRFPIDYTTRLLFATNGVATATWAYQIDILRMQGALSINGTFYISRSNGASTNGDLFKWVPGNTTTKYTGALEIGCEDLSYNRNADEL
ncbi:hypothetical protein C0995_011472 [Termitomyces sp. Mi166|nr:hypothetical protein C0995_011472 [Termitomyces sp. Mi166\